MKTEMKRDIDQIITGGLSSKMENIWPLGKVQEMALMQANTLPVGLRVGIEQLLPNQVYENLSTGERSHIGRCISLLVGIGELPLDRLDPTGVTKRYLTQ
jgi:hypothetical protein